MKISDWAFNFGCRCRGRLVSSFSQKELIHSYFIAAVEVLKGDILELEIRLGVRRKF